MYLLILESIGTPELLLVGLVALIIFGPRKLPEMMRTFGKAMAEFRRSTNEFKESWEKEVNFDDIEKNVTENKNLLQENTIGRNALDNNSELASPEIKEINQEDFQKAFPVQKSVESNELEKERYFTKEEPKKDLTDKRDWL